MDAALTGPRKGLIACIVERFDDRLNPVLVKELRQAVQGRYVASALMLFVTVSVAMMGWMIAAGSKDPTRLTAGREFFQMLYVVLTGTCLLFVPLVGSARLLAERSGEHGDLMFISSMLPDDIAFGKVQASAALTLLIFSACLPFMSIALLMRGLDLPAVVAVLFSAFVSTVVASAAMLAAASVQGPVRAIVVRGLGVVFFAILSVETVMRGIRAVNLGVGDAVENPFFWVHAGLTVAMAWFFVRSFGRNTAGNFWRPKSWLWALIRGDFALAVLLWLATAILGAVLERGAVPCAAGGYPGFLLLILAKVTQPRFRPWPRGLRSPLLSLLDRQRERTAELSEFGLDRQREEALRIINEAFDAQPDSEPERSRQE